MWSARSGGPTPAVPGTSPRGRTTLTSTSGGRHLPGRRGGKKLRATRGFDRLHESTVSQALCCDDS